MRDLEQLVSDLKSAPIPTCSWCARQHHGGPEHCLRGVLLVCGGRDYHDRAHVFRVLDKAMWRIEISAVRHGACSHSTRNGVELTGADRWADEWARARGLPVDPMPADWARHGPRAGPLRNQAMLDKGDVVCLIAFPGGAGTADMVRRATQRDLLVWQPARPQQQSGV